MLCSRLKHKASWKEYVFRWPCLLRLADLKQGMNEGEHAGVDLLLCLHPLDLPGFLALLGAGRLGQLQHLIALTHHCAH